MIARDDIEAMVTIWTALSSWESVIGVMAEVAEAQGRPEVAEALKGAVDKLEG